LHQQSGRARVQAELIFYFNPFDDFAHLNYFSISRCLT
jgi:hypothetical protein